MLATLYVLLGVSVFMPFYTYALYPFILRLFTKRSRKIKCGFSPTVSILVIGSEDSNCIDTKLENLRCCDYPNIVEIKTVIHLADAGSLLRTLKGEVVVITDDSSSLQQNAITLLVSNLYDERVGLVCGILRKAPDAEGKSTDGANWHYENKIKMLESNIGCLSGANPAIYAIKKHIIPSNINKGINLDFFLATHTTQQGYDVVFEPSAIAYEGEEKSEEELFRKHIFDSSSGYCSIVKFWRLLLPHKGSFVFWSHRVMKWLVPLNIIMIMLCCFSLAHLKAWALVASCIIMFGIIYFVIYNQLFAKKQKSLPSILGKLSDFGLYFLVLNIAYLFGFIHSLKKQQ